MGSVVSLQSSYVEVLIPSLQNMTVFDDSVFKLVIKLK